MGEPKRDALDLAFEKMLNKLEGYKPRPYFNSEEVEICRGVSAINLKSAYAQSRDAAEVIELTIRDNGETPKPMTDSEARSLIKYHLFQEVPDEPDTKTKIQLNMPVGTAQLVGIWAKRENRTVTSCVVEALLRGLSAMKADGHIPAAVLEENEFSIRLDQIHEHIKDAMTTFLDEYKEES